jgi:hypothetical protein
MNISALLVPDTDDKRTHNNKGRGHAWRATLQDKAPRPSEFQVTMSFTLSVSHTWARGGGGRGPRAGKCAPPPLAPCQALSRAAGSFRTQKGPNQIT